MRRFARYGWLPLLVLGMTGIAGLTVLAGLSMLEDRLVVRAGRDLQWAAMEIGAKLDLLLFERYGDMRVLAGTLQEMGSDDRGRRWTEHLQRVQQAYPIYAWIGVLDGAGRVVATTDPATLGLVADGTDRFRAPTGRPAVGVHDVQRDPWKKEREIVALSAPIAVRAPTRSASSFQGTVVTHIDVSDLEAIVTRTLRDLETKTKSLHGLEFQVLTGPGRVFLDSIPRPHDSGNLPALGVESARLALAGEAGFLQEDDRRRGVPVLTGYASMSSRKELNALPWAVLVRMDREAVLAPVHSAARTAALWGGSLFLPLLGVLLWAAGRLRKKWRLAEDAKLVSNEEQELLRTTLENALDSFVLMDQEGVVQFWNLKAVEVFGWSREEAVGQRLAELIVPVGYREAHERGLKKFLATGTGPLLGKRFEIEARHKNGHHLPVELMIVPLKRSGGYLFSGFIRDITLQVQQQRRKAAEHRVAEILLESASFEAACQEVAKTVCGTLDWRVGVLWSVDEEMQVLQYVDVWHASGKNLDPFLERTKQSRFASGIGLPGRVWKSGKVEWIADVTRDGNFPRAPFAAEVGLHAAFAFPIRSGEKVRAVMEFFADDSQPPDRNLLDMFDNVAAQLSLFVERQEMGQKLRDAQSRAEQAVIDKMALLATVEAFFIRLTDVGVVCEWTGKAENLFDIPLTDAIGRNFQDLAIGWSWEPILEAVGRAAETVSTVRLDKVRLQTREGRERFLKLTLSPLCRDAGIDIVIMGEDITDHLLLEHDLAQAQKLESIGQLAAGIAHEINTPTQFVGDNLRFLSDSFADLLAVLDRDRDLLASAKIGNPAPDIIEACEAERRRAELDYLMEEIPKALTQSAEGVQRVAKIVRAMKDFAHPGSDENTHADLNAAIESTVTVSRNEWKYVADLKTDLAPDLPPVPCLLSQFNQVILNMIVNAAHAIGEAVKGTGQKGLITITTRRVGEWAEIRITDTGTGIPEAIRHKIFDPFFTTKEVGKGTGQGLAISRSVIVGKHGGTIGVETEVGKGTTFIVRLPLHGLGEAATKGLAA